MRAKSVNFVSHLRHDPGFYDAMNVRSERKSRCRGAFWRSWAFRPARLVGVGARVAEWKAVSGVAHEEGRAMITDDMVDNSSLRAYYPLWECLAEYDCIAARLAMTRSLNAVLAAVPGPWRPISEYDRRRDGPGAVCERDGDKTPTVAIGPEQGEWWVNVCMSAVEKPDIWMPQPRPPKGIMNAAMRGAVMSLVPIGELRAIAKTVREACYKAVSDGTAVTITVEPIGLLDLLEGCDVYTRLMRDDAIDSPSPEIDRLHEQIMLLVACRGDGRAK